MKRITVSKTVWILDKVDLAIILTDLSLSDICILSGLKKQTIQNRIKNIAKRYGVEPDLIKIRTTVPNKPEFKTDLLASVLSGELGITLQDILKLKGDTNESISNKNDIKICKN